MKKVFFTALSVSFLGFTSCGNDLSENLSSSDENTLTKKEEKNVISFDILIAHDRSMYTSWSRSPY